MAGVLEILAAFYGFITLYACAWLGCQWLAARLERWQAGRISA